MASRHEPLSSCLWYKVENKEDDRCDTKVLYKWQKKGESESKSYFAGSRNLG